LSVPRSPTSTLFPYTTLFRSIAYFNTNEFGDDLKGSYLIKVTNRSFFISYDIKANIEKLIAYHVNNGTNDRSFDLELVDPTTNFLSGRNLFKNEIGRAHV